jgi:hypothetical protein
VRASAREEAVSETYLISASPMWLSTGAGARNPHK